jgi:hypothetical protein
MMVMAGKMLGDVMKERLEEGAQGKISRIQNGFI